MLTAGDEYPIHQTPEPIAYSGSERNFYDRYFFNGYSADGKTFFAAAMGVYPALNVMDGAVSIVRNGKQSSIFVYRPLNMERMDTFVGPLSVSVVEPLRKIRLKLEETDGIALDVEFTGRAFPIEEPRFTRRIGPRMMMDVTRMTQNGNWAGKLRIDGEEITVSPQSWYGTRDRSWGIRPVGEPDPQPSIPAAIPQFFWIWTPMNFETHSLFYHVNHDGAGESWNTRSVILPDGAGQGDGQHFEEPNMDIRFAKGTRRMETAILSLKDKSGGQHTVEYEPAGTFLMKGIGYGHPKYRHGSYQGEQVAAAREDYDLANSPWHEMENLHIQEIVRAVHTLPDGKTVHGIGAYEQLFFGPHAPSGFKELLDPAG